MSKPSNGAVLSQSLGRNISRNRSRTTTSTSHNHNNNDPSPHVINTSTLSHLFHSGGSTWKRGSFCEDFLERRYHADVPVCKKGSQVRCFWNPSNAHAATCDIDQLLVKPHGLWKSMDNVEGTFPHSGAVGLLDDDHITCGQSSINRLGCILLLLEFF